MRTGCTVSVVAGSRSTSWSERSSAAQPPEEIAQDFPSMQFPDIYQVIGYYLKHGSELAEYFDRRNREEQAIWKRTRTSGPLVAYASACWPGARTGEVQSSGGLLRKARRLDFVRAQEDADRVAVRVDRDGAGFAAGRRRCR
jgi:uncharacterized protein (DUF433 family)